MEKDETKGQETTAPAMLELLNDQVDEITLIESDIAYKKGKRHENGKKFNTYRYNGIVFTVPSDSPFVEHQSNGTLFKVKLKTGTRTVTEVVNGIDVDKLVDTLEFDSAISTIQKLNKAKFNSNIAVLRKLDQQPVTSELLHALQNAE